MMYKRTPSANVAEKCMIERSMEKMLNMSQATHHTTSNDQARLYNNENDTKSCNIMMDVAWQCISERLWKYRDR